MEKILGLHHITAIAGDAQRNFDFYTKTLGLRMVKKTVNFDDPQTYHFYFGDEVGNPGTILTFFPWPRVKQGVNGAGMATEIGYSIGQGSLDYWIKRFDDSKVAHSEISELFGEKQLRFTDPDGLELTLIETQDDSRTGHETDSVKKDAAIKGFHSVTLTVRDSAPTAAILTDVFNYNRIAHQRNVTRYKTDAVTTAAIVDIVEDAEAAVAVNAGGTNHHVAFRVKDEETLMAFREKIAARGLHITEKINRDYFYSIYFREPGGVLFEIATDNPGFATDETVAELGSRLQLPKRYERIRAEIENVLPIIK